LNKRTIDSYVTQAVNFAFVFHAGLSVARFDFIRIYLKIDLAASIRHARESGHPEITEKPWIPVYTGMTVSTSIW
jgi:hypothetical protein